MLDDVNANCNKGFAARKVLLGTSDEVNCEIPLNRYSFFDELQDKLLPNVSIELQIEMENDKNLIWRVGAADAAGTTYRLIVTRLQLYVPRMIFNSEGQKLYLENYLKPHKWTYLTETTYNEEPTLDPSRVFRDVMKYVNANNDLHGGTLLDISNFKNLYPFVYFDLTKQRTDLKDGNTKLSFHYTLSGTTATEYTIYGIVISEKDAEIDKESGKLLLRG